MLVSVTIFVSIIDDVGGRKTYIAQRLSDKEEDDACSSKNDERDKVDHYFVGRSVSLVPSLERGTTDSRRC